MESMRRLLVVVLAVAALSAPSQAQFGRRGGGGGGGGGGAAGGGRSRDTLSLSPRAVPGVAALVLDHAGDFSLADSQRVVLESIRHTQDSANRPWLLRLDSLRPTSRPANPNDLSQEQQDEIAARRTAMAAVMEGMRETNALARQRTMAVLSPAQQVRAAELENDARKKADEERTRARDAAGAADGEGRRGGRGRGRPPED
jgi:hypothetical protein